MNTNSANKELLSMAVDARKRAYAPYSHFAVGAALMTADGTVFTGCNIENASFGATVCAERTALSKAVSEGHTDFVALAIVGRKGGSTSAPICAPCGICRQVLSEFCKKDFPILMSGDGESYQKTTLGELLPFAFGGDNL